MVQVLVISNFLATADPQLFAVEQTVFYGFGTHRPGMGQAKCGRFLFSGPNERTGTDRTGPINGPVQTEQLLKMTVQTPFVLKLTSGHRTVM